MLKEVYKKRGHIVGRGIMTDTSPDYDSTDLADIARLLTRPDPKLNRTRRPDGQEINSQTGLVPSDITQTWAYYDQGLSAPGYIDTAFETRWGAPGSKTDDELRSEIFARYLILMEIAEGYNVRSVLNIGEGSGAHGTSFADFLKYEGLEKRITSWGIDLNANSVQTARRRNSDYSQRLFVMNLLNEDKPSQRTLETSGKLFPWFPNDSAEFPEQVDITIGSGIFCLEVHDPDLYIEQMFRRMYAKSRIGFAVNFMSQPTADYKEATKPGEAQLLYIRPDKILVLAQKLQKDLNDPDIRITLGNIPGKPYEFTVSVLKGTVSQYAISLQHLRTLINTSKALKRSHKNQLNELLRQIYA